MQRKSRTSFEGSSEPESLVYSSFTMHSIKFLGLSGTTGALLYSKMHYILSKLRCISTASTSTTAAITRRSKPSPYEAPKLIDSLLSFNFFGLLMFTIIRLNDFFCIDKASQTLESKGIPLYQFYQVNANLFCKENFTFLHFLTLSFIHTFRLALDHIPVFGRFLCLFRASDHKLLGTIPRNGLLCISSFGSLCD